MSQFKVLDGHTLFQAAQCWLHIDDATGQQEMRSSEGVWPWERVLSVQTIAPTVLPDMPEPRCLVELDSNWVYLAADFQTVLQAYRRYRLRYGGRSLTFTTDN